MADSKFAFQAGLIKFDGLQRFRVLFVDWRDLR
jgi:hypothetical protein